MCIFRKALAPSVILACLPILDLEASAEVVSVPDGAGTWEVRISPQGTATDPVGPANSPILLTAFQEENEFETTVPDPIELTPVDAAAPVPEPTPTFEAADAPAAADVAALAAAPSPAAMVDPALYWSVYCSVPFIRTEYLANPSYRHEAAMEILFGQLRPTVIHKHQHAATPAPILQPAPVPPYVYDIYLGQIPTFMNRYQPPAIPFGYPLTY